MEHYLEHADPLDSRQFLIAIKRLADSLSYGTDLSNFIGQGIEYAQSRPYQHGDPIKSIDWRVTARMGKTYVKEYEVPKSIPVWLIIDTSASMTISSTLLSKYALAVQIAGGIALTCLDRVSPVGIMGAGDRDILIKPTLSRETMLQWMYNLRHHSIDENTQLGNKLKTLAPSLTENSLIIVLSDFHDPNSIEALKLLGQRHDCMALQLQDPAENSLQGAGFFHAKEAENTKNFVTHGKQTLSNRNQLHETLRNASIDHLLIQTDKPFISKLRHFLHLRNSITETE